MEIATTPAESAAGHAFSVKPRVFVSRPAVLAREQDVRCQQWLRHLALLGFEGDGEGWYRCPCHGSTFDGNGQVTGGPATKPLINVPVQVVDGQVTTA
jgi:Rieske Fe-S protein